MEVQKVEVEVEVSRLDIRTPFGAFYSSSQPSLSDSLYNSNFSTSYSKTTITMKTFTSHGVTLGKIGQGIMMAT